MIYVSRGSCLWIVMLWPRNIDIKTNTHPIRTLTGVRDELLPKVMSGEVGVGY